MKPNKESNPVKPTTFLKSEFNKKDNEERKPDTGYIGGVSTVLGYTRTKMDGEITLKDSLRWKEGLELFLFGMFGGNRVGVPSTETGETGLYVYNFGDGSNLPYWTVLQGINMGLTGDELLPSIRDNAIISSFKLSLADDGNITCEIGFMNDYPLYNIVPTEPTRTYAPTSYIVSKANVKIGVGDIGTLESALILTDCITSLEADFKYKAESKSCYADTFGTNNLSRGNLESTVKYSMALNQNNMRLEEKFSTGKVGGVRPTEKVFKQKIVIFIDGYEVTTGKKTSAKIVLPEIALKPPERSTSGDGDATLEVEADTTMDIITGQMVNIRVASELPQIPQSAGTYTVP